MSSLWRHSSPNFCMLNKDLNQWANLFWCHCLHFSSLAYDSTHTSRGSRYEPNAKIERADWVEEFVQFFQLFASNIEGNISHQKLRNCCVAKKLMSHTFSVKFRVFRREFLRNHLVYWAQIFRDNWNCYALSIFRVFILLTSSDSDKHVLMITNILINKCSLSRVCQN